MPRTTLTKTTAPGPDPAAGVVVTMTAADVGSLNQFALTGREVLIIQNSGASTRTYTVTSVADERGRTKDITTQNILAGEIHVIGPVSLAGWRQTDGMLYLQANHAEVKFGIVTLP